MAGVAAGLARTLLFVFLLADATVGEVAAARNDAANLSLLLGSLEQGVEALSKSAKRGASNQWQGLAQESAQVRSQIVGWVRKYETLFTHCFSRDALEDAQREAILNRTNAALTPDSDVGKQTLNQLRSAIAQKLPVFELLQQQVQDRPDWGLALLSAVNHFSPARAVIDSFMGWVASQQQPQPGVVALLETQVDPPGELIFEGSSAASLDISDPTSSVKDLKFTATHPEDPTSAADSFEASLQESGATGGTTLRSFEGTVDESKEAASSIGMSGEVVKYMFQTPVMSSAFVGEASLGLVGKSVETSSDRDFLMSWSELELGSTVQGSDSSESSNPSSMFGTAKDGEDGEDKPGGALGEAMENPGPEDLGGGLSPAGPPFILQDSSKGDGDSGPETSSLSSSSTSSSAQSMLGLGPSSSTSLAQNDQGLGGEKDKQAAPVSAGCCMAVMLVIFLLGVGAGAEFYIARMFMYDPDAYEKYLEENIGQQVETVKLYLASHPKRLQELQEALSQVDPDGEDDDEEAVGNGATRLAAIPLDFKKFIGDITIDPKAAKEADEAASNKSNKGKDGKKKKKDGEEEDQPEDTGEKKKEKGEGMVKLKEAVDEVMPKVLGAFYIGYNMMPPIFSKRFTFYVLVIVLALLLSLAG